MKYCQVRRQGGAVSWCYDECMSPAYDMTIPCLGEATRTNNKSRKPALIQEKMIPMEAVAGMSVLAFVTFANSLPSLS